MRPLNDIVFNDFTMEYLKALLTPVSKEELFFLIKNIHKTSSPYIERKNEKKDD